MSRVLSELLGAAEPMFTATLRRLESQSGQAGVDVRLLSEISQKTRQKMRELGLDPKDTTGRELYHALQAVTEKHDGFLARSIGVSIDSKTEEILERVVTAVDKLDIPKTCWAIKHSVAKRLLKQTPPKRVMKQLGYRSVDSLLKREKIDEISAGIKVLESQTWQDKFIKNYKGIGAMDFESRKIAIVKLTPVRWGAAAETYARANKSNVIDVKECGVVALLPLPADGLPGVTLVSSMLLLHAINDIRLYSSFFKMHQVMPDFAEVLIKTLLFNNHSLADLAGEPLKWRTIHRYFGSVSRGKHPDIFKPHVQPEDLVWQKVEQTLYKIEPALKFWDDMDYMAMLEDDGPVSFNLMDNVIALCNKIPYQKRPRGYFRDNLWNEILVRYIGQEQLEQSVIDQLDKRFAETEMETTGV